MQKNKKDKKTFLKIIKKAEKEGYKEHIGFLPLFVKDRKNIHKLLTEIIWNVRYQIMFSKEFAKAFWGDGKSAGKSILNGKEWEVTLVDKTIKYKNMKNWKYHLQQLVLETDKISYLQKFL